MGRLTEMGVVSKVPVVPACIIPVQVARFPAVQSGETGARAVGPQWVEEFFEGRMETSVA